LVCATLDSSTSSPCFFFLSTKSLNDNLTFVGATEAGGTADEIRGKDGAEDDAGRVCAAEPGAGIDEGSYTGGPVTGERGKAIEDPPRLAPPPPSRHPHKPLEPA
jgi:hypothetical protein